ncbi:MAG: DUF4276 family protein [Alphaproteobacteria bacterium]|nr:DUF4276 family protein [Alphaproteobacteria bacterium]
MAPTAACVVEGYGEVQALPELLRRVVAWLPGPHYFVEVKRPIRQARDRLVRRAGELEKAAQLAALKAGPGGWVLILLDADDDLPCQLAPELLDRLSFLSDVNGVVVSVVLADREFESWFLASAESLRGHRGLPADLERPGEILRIRGAKEWLSERMARGQKYSPTRDQVALCARMDLGEARAHSASFDKLCRECEAWLRTLS